MESETALVIVTLFLLLTTAYYAWKTREILKEQRRAVEYQIKPIIGIRHPSYPTKKIEFVVSRNDVFNLNATVTINSISDEQKLDSVLIDPDSSSGYSKGFNLETLLSKVAKSSLATLTIRIEYQSFSNYRYCEEFYYHCTLTEGGMQNIIPHVKHPIKRKLIKEGY